MEGAVDMLDTIDDRLTFKQLEYFENKRLQYVVPVFWLGTSPDATRRSLSSMIDNVVELGCLTGEWPAALYAYTESSEGPMAERDDAVQRTYLAVQAFATEIKVISRLRLHCRNRPSPATLSPDDFYTIAQT
jgi:hypothetical protein